MNYTSSSWFPLKNFTKSNCHKDYMVGVSKWKCKDYLYPDKTINPYDTVIWNRSLGNISISLQNYHDAIKSNNEDVMNKMKEINLPFDIKM